MRYDTESGKIKIALSEFVSISRRGISPALPFDDDEPNVSEPSKRRIRAILGETSPEKIYFGFEAAGHSFELSMNADSVFESSVTVAREISSSPEKPKRAEESEARGEAFILGHAIAELCGYPEMTIRLVYLNSATGEFSIKEETVKQKKLSDFFEKCRRVVEKYAIPEVERVTKRLPSMRNMKFPYATVREGQSEFIRSAYRTLARGGSLFAQAPTGTGKTVSALFPAMRALGEGRAEKIFYLTPKSTTAEAVKDCLSIMEERGVIARAIVLTAKEKACMAGRLCKKSRALCPNAKCNNLADATLELYNLQKAVVSAEEAQEVSQKWGVCPYELMLAYTELSDIVVCDFNHVFDPRAYIRRFFDKGGDYLLLVDEAHNLVERAREIYSAELSEEDILAPQRSDALGEFSGVKKLSPEACRVFHETLMPYIKDELRENKDGELIGATSISSIPERFYTLFDELLTVADEELRVNIMAKDDEASERVRVLREYYYTIKRFADVISRFDECYKLFAFYEKGAIRVKLYCLDSAPQIRERLEICHGALFFSATLSPLGYYKAVLGGERSDDVLDVESPFAPEQLSVTVMDKVSTRYSEREDTLLAVCRVIAATVSAKRGHYMIFSPSFAYSDALAKAFSAKYPKIKIISQKKNMTAAEKRDFLDAFKNEDGTYLVAFCVMGGIYSEGVDLAGDSLIGAVIVGIGIPSLSYEREAIAEYYEEKYEMGKQYAYIYPGMNRVFQAAGRVIRREDDKGAIVLIDDRFDDPIYKKSLPKLWQGVKFIGDPKRLREILDEFWRDDRAKLSGN